MCTCGVHNVLHRYQFAVLHSRRKHLYSVRCVLLQASSRSDRCRASQRSNNRNPLAAFSVMQLVRL